MLMVAPFIALPSSTGASAALCTSRVLNPGSRFSEEVNVTYGGAEGSVHELLDSTVPDDHYLGRELGRYFPKPV